MINEENKSDDGFFGVEDTEGGSEQANKFKFEIGQKVYYAGIAYRILEKYIDAGKPWYIIRPFTRSGISYHGLPVPEEALLPEFRENEVIRTFVG